MIQDKFIKNHRYILSFENSHCEDYSTEKYWYGLRFGAIPIVLSHEKNEYLLIPNSYINAMNFSHPYYLAKYLRELNKNGSYNRFYRWREYYNPRFDTREIDSCEILEKITKNLAANKIVDETVNKIDDTYICSSPEYIKSKVLKPI